LEKDREQQRSPELATALLQIQKQNRNNNLTAKGKKHSTHEEEVQQQQTRNITYQRKEEQDWSEQSSARE